MMWAMQKDLDVLKTQELPNGLMVAGGGDYDKVWIRDNVYVAMAFLEAGLVVKAATIYEQLFRIIQKYEYILDLGKYPETETDLLPPRFTPEGAKVAGQWGNKQYDAIGVVLFGLGQLYEVHPDAVSTYQEQLCQKLITYLENCRYWEDPDDGMWEDQPTLHTSSLAACIRGIESVSPFCNFNKDYIEYARANLKQLLPRESTLHTVDMAQLSLIWPYGYRLIEIVNNVEKNLLRVNGVIRFAGDVYEAQGNAEPQWVMGIPWLGIAHFELGDTAKAQYYHDKMQELYTSKGLPEAYVAHNETCIHTPLAWSHAMALILRVKLANAGSKV